MKKVKLVTNEKGWIYCTTGDWFFDKSYHIKDYADSINRQTMPLIMELCMNTDIKSVIMYSCKGGMERLKNAYLKDYAASEQMKKLATKSFNISVDRHPEFREFANSWRWNRFLVLDDEGMVAFDEESYKRSRDVYIKDPENIKFVKNKLVPLVDMMNSMFEEGQTGQYLGYMWPHGAGSIIYWNGHESGYAISWEFINDYQLTRLRTHWTKTWNGSDFSDGYMEEANKRFDAELQENIKGFGFSNKEAEEIVKNLDD